MHIYTHLVFMFCFALMRIPLVCLSLFLEVILPCRLVLLLETRAIEWRRAGAGMV